MIVSSLGKHQVRFVMRFSGFLAVMRNLQVWLLTNSFDCAAFEDLKSQVWSRLYGWKEKNLAIVGKEVLIKSVIQAIPSYVMSFFQLPVRLCKELTQTTAAYWWGQKHSEKKMHWAMGQLMCS